MAAWHEQWRTAGGSVPHRQWKLFAARQHWIIYLELHDVLERCSSGGHAAPAGCTATATISRYDVYRYEITQNWLSDPNQTQSNPKEIGAPQCTGATAATTERRLLNVAIVNCLSSPVPIQSNAQNVPVAAFGSFFLTHAAPTSGTNKPFAEFRGIIGRGNGVLYDQVQLYR